MSVLKEKFSINYYAELGIIDLFGLSLSKDDLKERIEFDFHDSYGSNLHSFYQQVDIGDVEAAVNEIKQTIKRDANEEPHIVRFFAMPDFMNLGFKLYPIAKIGNNGSTFVFSDNKEIFEFLNLDNGYYVSIKKLE